MNISESHQNVGAGGNLHRQIVIVKPT